MALVENMFRSYKYLVFLTSALFFLYSCYHSEKENGNYFYYNDYSGIASLDPAFAKNQSITWAVHQLYNTLVEVDSALEIKPSVAKRWEISQDGKVYTFYLRDDVFFHDDECFEKKKGRRLVAKDVVYSFKRLSDKKIASPGAWIFNDKVDSINGFISIDDTTLQVRLLKPYHPILGILSMQYCSIVPQEAINKYGGDFRRHPVGTGPFAIVAWEEGQGLIMKKNDHYFERDETGKRLPYIDGIKVSFFDSRATEFLLFRQGKVDFINDIDATFKDEVLTKKGTLRKEWEGKVQLQTHPYLNVEYFGILVDSTNDLVKRSPTRSKNLRQAINYGFDREKMVLYLRNSLGIPAQSGFVPTGLPSFDSAIVKGYSYNPALAKKLLTEAGFTDGNMPMIRLTTISIYSNIADFIAKQLGDIGLKIQVEIVQKSLLLEMTATSRALFFRGSWIADYPDAENFLSVFYSKNPAPPNYTRYKNKTFDDLFEKAMRETNDSLRYKLYRAADQVLINDAPVVPLWYDMVVHLVQPNVNGFKPNALNLLELRRVRKE